MRWGNQLLSNAVIINLHLDFTAPALPENNQDEWPNTPGHKEPLRAVCAPQPPTVSANQRLLGTLQHKGRVRGDPVQPERGKGAEKWGTTSSHLCSGILSTKTIENVGPLCTYRHKDGSLVCTRMVLCSLSSSLLFFFLWCLYLFFSHWWFLEHFQLFHSRSEPTDPFPTLQLGLEGRNCHQQGQGSHACIEGGSEACNRLRSQPCTPATHNVPSSKPVLRQTSILKSRYKTGVLVDLVPHGTAKHECTSLLLAAPDIT